VWSPGGEGAGREPEKPRDFQSGVLKPAVAPALEPPCFYRLDLVHRDIHYQIFEFKMEETEARDSACRFSCHPSDRSRLSVARRLRVRVVYVYAKVQPRLARVAPTWKCIPVGETAVLKRSREV